MMHPSKFRTHVSRSRQSAQNDNGSLRPKVVKHPRVSIASPRTYKARANTQEDTKQVVMSGIINDNLSRFGELSEFFEPSEFCEPSETPIQLCDEDISWLEEWLN